MGVKLNWPGVIAATVAAFFIGFLWYGILFEETWTALSGAPTEGEASWGWMALGLLQTFVIMTGLGWLVARLGGGWIGGFKIGLAAAIFFALTTSAYGFIYQTSNPGLLPIDWSHLLVIYGLGGALIGGVRLKGRGG